MGLHFIDVFVSEKLGLTKLPPYLPTFYWSFVGFLFVHQVLAPWFSNKWFPRAYGGKSKMAKNSRYMSSRKMGVRSRVWVGGECRLCPCCCLYFFWDTLDAAINFTNLGFVIHGLACFLIYTMSFKPFVAYYGTRCLLWEASTFFLNINWFLDKTGRTGGHAQLVNGLFLLTTFFGVRILYGGTIAYQFFITLLDVRHDISLPYRLVYGLGCLVLQGLNWLWFTKMIFAIRKRFSTTDERTKLIGRNGNGTAYIENGSRID